MTNALSLAVVTAAALSGPALAQSNDPVDMLHKVAMLPQNVSVCANGTQTPRLYKLALRSENNDRSADIITIMCLAAQSDGDVAHEEAREIARTKRQARIAPSAAALEPKNDLPRMLGHKDRPYLEVALRRTMAVITAEGGINADEQAFLGNMVQAAALSQSDVRKILGLTD